MEKTLHNINYLGIKNNENLICKQQISDLAIKFNRANAILPKLKHFLEKNSEINISCTILVFFGYKIQVQFIFLKKSLKIIYSLTHYAHIFPVFKESKILILPDKIPLENCFYINNLFKKILPRIFENWFTLSADSYTYNTRWSHLSCLLGPPCNTIIYGRN